MSESMVYGLDYQHCTQVMSLNAKIHPPPSIYPSASDSARPVLVEKSSHSSSMPLFPGRANLYSKLFQFKQQCGLVALEVPPPALPVYTKMFKLYLQGNIQVKMTKKISHF